jgi:N-methylhydantoinase A
VFSLSLIDAPIELVNWKVEALGPLPVMEMRHGLDDAGGASGPLKGRRAAYFPDAGGFVDCPVYDRYRMQPGAVIEGPALVEERESTCVIGPGQMGRIDPFHNLVVTVPANEDAR